MHIGRRQRIGEIVTRDVVQVGEVLQLVRADVRLDLAAPGSASREQEVDAGIVAQESHRVENRPELVDQARVPGVHHNGRGVEP